jgi:hypothetical protein
MKRANQPLRRSGIFATGKRFAGAGLALPILGAGTLSFGNTL